MSSETLTFTIDKKKIKADHQYADDTGRAFKDQKEGADQLKAFIRDEVVFQNKTEGFIPYNNFESSVTWKVIDKNLERFKTLTQFKQTPKQED